MAPLHFGCLLFDYQAIDVLGPVDLVNSCSKTYMQTLAPMTGISQETLDRAPDVFIHHIGVTMEPVKLGSSLITIVPTTTVDDCPELDILLIGGPDPFNFKLDPKHAEFIRRYVAAGKLLFATCTGALVVASTGVLDGKNATINNGIIPVVQQMHPNVKWIKEKKWIIDGNIWTGGGAIAGMDMFAHWIKETYGLDVLIYAAAMLDFEPRDIDGVLNVIPKKYDESGKQTFTYVFP